MRDNPDSHPIRQIFREMRIQDAREPHFRRRYLTGCAEALAAVRRASGQALARQAQRGLAVARRGGGVGADRAPPALKLFHVSGSDETASHGEASATACLATRVGAVAPTGTAVARPRAGIHRFGSEQGSDVEGLYGARSPSPAPRPSLRAAGPDGGPWAGRRALAGDSLTSKPRRSPPRRRGPCSGAGAGWGASSPPRP